MAKSKPRPKKARAEKRANSAEQTVLSPSKALQVLPGEEAVSESLIDAAVQRINEIHRQKGIELASELGEYLLETFFDNDFAAFHDRSKKHMSFRRLAERSDLNVSHKMLWTSVAVVEQRRQLPRAVSDALPLAHHKLLLSVRDAETKSKLATEAVEKKLSSRKLEEKVLRAKKKAKRANPGGRPKLPGWFKDLGKLGRVLAERETTPPTAEEVRAQGIEETESLLEGLRQAVSRVSALQSAVEAALAAAKKAG